MSMFDYVFDNEYQQRDDINALRKQKVNRREMSKVETQINKGIKRDRRQDQQIIDLEDAVSELAITQKALIQYIIEEDNFDPEKFKKIMVSLTEEK